MFTRVQPLQTLSFAHQDSTHRISPSLKPFRRLFLLISTCHMDFRYHDRDEYPHESRRTSDHARHRHEGRSDHYHHTSARMRSKEGHRYQDEFDVPASQPGKTDYVQSWLQRSQATRARPPEPIAEDRPEKISPRVHMVKQASQKKKRTRSESPEPAHPREAHSPVALRFEKRSRHKTRPNKYEYKPEVDRNKRWTKTKEHWREDSNRSLEGVQIPKQGEYQHVVGDCMIVSYVDILILFSHSNGQTIMSIEPTTALPIIKAPKRGRSKLYRDTLTITQELWSRD